MRHDEIAELFFIFGEKRMIFQAILNPSIGLMTGDLGAQHRGGHPLVSSGDSYLQLSFGSLESWRAVESG